MQETRLFDTSNFTTRSMRSKEDSAEYRYFPDPDLLTVEISDEMLEEARRIPELPNEKKERYINELGLKKDDAEVIISSYEHAKFFEDLINASPKPTR